MMFQYVGLTDDHTPGHQYGMIGKRTFLSWFCAVPVLGELVRVLKLGLSVLIHLIVPSFT